jgi:hypothetical protein
MQVKPFLKSTSPSSPLGCHKNPTENYAISNSILTLLMPGCCAVQFSVSWSSEMQFCFMYLQTWASIQSHFAFWHLTFICISLFWEKWAGTQFSFLPKGGCLLFHVRSFSVCLLMGLVSCLVVWVWGTLPKNPYSRGKFICHCSHTVLTILVKIVQPPPPPPTLVISGRNVNSFISCQISHSSVQHKQVAYLHSMIHSHTVCFRFCSTVCLTDISKYLKN